MVTSPYLDLAARAHEQAERALRAIQNIANQQQQELGECGSPCSATLTIDVRRITIVKKVNGQISTQPGDKGQGIGSVTVGSETRCYNSALAAQQAAQALINERNRRNADYDFENQKLYRFGPSSVSPDLGLKPDGSGDRCPEPAQADWAQIGTEQDIPQDQLDLGFGD